MDAVIDFDHHFPLHIAPSLMNANLLETGERIPVAAGALLFPAVDGRSVLTRSACHRRAEQLEFNLRGEANKVGCRGLDDAGTLDRVVFAMYLYRCEWTLRGGFG